MAKKGGKTSPAAKPEEKKQGQEQHYDYTSFMIPKMVGSRENPKNSLRKKDWKDDKSPWILNVQVPQSVSPTGWMDVELPGGKLSTDPEGKKNRWFKTAHKNKDGQESQNMVNIYIANEVGELKGIATGAEGREGVGQEISITPLDLRKAVIEQYKTSQEQRQAASAEREVPEVNQAEAGDEGLSR